MLLLKRILTEERAKPRRGIMVYILDSVYKNYAIGVESGCDSCAENLVYTPGNAAGSRKFQ